MRIIAIFALLLVAGCSQPIEKTARDGIATAAGAIKNYQSQYKAECTAASTGKACVAINRAVSANNLAIDSLETYCGFKPGDDLASACKPVPSAKAGLVAALGNLRQLIGDLKEVTK